MNSKSGNAFKFYEKKSGDAPRFDGRKSCNAFRFDERKLYSASRFDERKSCNASRFDERKIYNASKFDERKSCNASKFDEKQTITQRHHQSECVGPENLKYVKKKLSSYNEDKGVKTEHCEGFVCAKNNNTINISHNKENPWFRKRNRSFQLGLQPHDSYDKSLYASKSFTPENLFKVSHTTVVKLTDLKLPYMDTKASNYSRRVDSSISEDWDEECQSLKNQEIVSPPVSNSSTIDIKQNKYNLKSSHSALVSAYQDRIQIPSEPSYKSSQLGVDNKELMMKSGFQVKDFEGKKFKNESSKDSSLKEAEVQVDLNTNSQHIPQDLKTEGNSSLQLKYFHDSSYASDREKISEEDNNDVLNNSQLAITNVISDLTEVCTYDTCSEVSSDLEAEICSQSDEGEFINPDEAGDVKENCKRKKLLMHPEHCHPVIQESPGPSSGFPIESLNLPASSFGSKESLEKVINFMRSCAVKMFEFINSRQHLELNALITVSIPDITHNSSTCCSVDKVYPHCFHEIHNSKVEESSLFQHLFPFPSLPYVIPPYWQWNYWPEWHSPPIVASPHNREHFDYCTSDDAESLGHSHGAQIYHSLGLETGCGNNLHLQSEKSAMKVIDDDLSTKASRSETPSEHHVTGESNNQLSAASSLNQTKNTQAAFLQRKQLPFKRTQMPVQQPKQKTSLTNANTCNSHASNRDEIIPLHDQKTPSWQKVPVSSSDSSNPNTFMLTEHPKDGHNLADGHLNSSGPNAYSLMPTQFHKDGYSMTEGHLNSCVLNSNACMPPLPKKRYSLTVGNVINSYGANAFMLTQLPKDGFSMAKGHINANGPNAQQMPTQLPNDGYSMTEGHFNTYVTNTYMPTQLPKDGYSLTAGNSNVYSLNASTCMPTQQTKDLYSMTEGHFNAYGLNANACMPTQLPKDGSSNRRTEQNYNAYIPNANTYFSTQFSKDQYTMTAGNYNTYNANAYNPSQHPKDEYTMTARNSNANAYMPTQNPKDRYSLTGHFNAYGLNANTYMPTQLLKDGYTMAEEDSNTYNSNANTYMPTQLQHDGYTRAEGNSNAYNPNANTYMPTQLPKGGYTMVEGNSNSYNSNENTYMPTQLPKDQYIMPEGSSNKYNANANTYMPTQLPIDGNIMVEGNLNTYNPNAKTYMPTQLPKYGNNMVEGTSNTYNPNANTYMPTQNPKEGNNMVEGNSYTYNPNAKTYMPTQLPKDGNNMVEGNSNTYNPNVNTNMPTQNPKDGNSIIEGHSNSYSSNINMFIPTHLPKDGFSLIEESMTQTAIVETSRCKTDLEAVVYKDQKSQGHLEACQENVFDMHVNSEADSLVLPGAYCDTGNQSEANKSDHPKQQQSKQSSSAVEQHQKTNSTKTLQPGITFKNSFKSKYRLGSNLNILRRPLNILLPKMASSLVSKFKGSDSLHWRKDCKPLEPLQPSPKDLKSPKQNLKTDVGDHKLENKTNINTETSSQKGTPTSRWKNWNFSPSYWSPPESPSKSVDKQSQWTQEFISKSKTYKNRFIDSHCHLDFLYQRLNLESTPFKQFREENADYFPANYEGCLAVFCNPKTFAAEKPQNNIVNLLSEEEGVWFSFGCHPKNAHEFNDAHEVGLRQILTHPKVVSLGEIGLDYSGSFSLKAEIQKKVFKRQLLIAVELKLPIVIHCRDADDDCLQILQEIVPHDHRIHAHCFTRSMDIAVRWLTAFPNLFIGLTPLISYKTAMDAANTASFIPLDRLLLETDAPYFVPRTKQRIDAKFSFPGFALFTAEKVAELKGLPVDFILKACRENTRKMYGI